MRCGIIYAALKEAKKSTYRFKLGSIIYDGKRILGRGFNKPDKTHPKSPVPYKNIHSEFAALTDAINQHGSLSVRGSDIYTFRIRRDGKVGLAKPCVCCERMLLWAGIKHIGYTEDEGIL